MPFHTSWVYVSEMKKMNSVSVSCNDTFISPVLKIAVNAFGKKASVMAVSTNIGCV